VRRLFTVLTVVLAVATALLATRNISLFGSARLDARERLPLLQDATEEAFVGVLADAAAALRAWQPGAEVTAPLVRAESFVASSPPQGVVDVPAAGVGLRFRRGQPEVLLATEDGRTRRGLVSMDAVAARIAAHSSLGEPARPVDRVPGRYSRLLLVRGDTGAVVWTHGVAEAEGAAAARTRALIEIAAGRGSGGDEYKDGSGEAAVGAWRTLAATDELWVVAEIQDAAATMDLAGISLRGIGIDKDLFLWHLTLALMVLCLLVTVFFVVQKRGVRLDLLVRVFRFVKPYKWGAVAVILLGIAFTALTATIKVFFPQILIDDVLVNPGDDAERTLWTIGGLVVVAAFLTAGVGFGKMYLHHWYATRIMADIRFAIGRKIVSLPLSFFQRMRAGDLVARIERDAESMRKVFNQAFKTAAVDPFEMCIMVVAAFVQNWRLALVLLGMPLVVYPLFRIAKRIKQRAVKRQVLLAEISHVIFQMLVGIKVVKAFGGEERETTRLQDAIKRFLGQARRIHKLTALSESLLDLVQMTGAAIVMVAGGYFVLGGDVTVGEIVAFIVIIQRIYKSAKQLTNTANSLVDAASGVERVFEVLDAESDLVDGTEEMPARPLTQGIRFDGVSFAYDEKTVLDDVRLDIPAGQVVAVVGPTGAGKTTLCDLVARFYDPTDGAVLYDGADVRRFTRKSLVRNVGIVTQDAFLFNASLDENIRYGRPDASDEEVRRAAADAFVHDEIEKMEGGYGKLAGERGSAVSGGQRQRITIARAILKDAPVLILDEATSALDSHAETQVQAALEKLMAGRTVIVVAHRLSTIRNADKVVVMRDGRVVEEGAPAELLERDGGQFRRMYELQMGVDADGGGGDAAA
jgi:subfamily B ATP-binding cassette protein MsbA